MDERDERIAAQTNERLRLADEAVHRLHERVQRAAELLREWRDKYGGKEHYKMGHDGIGNTASPTDLIRDTQRWIEGK